MKNNRWKQKIILYAVIILIVIGVTIPAIRYYLAQKAEKDRLSQEAYFTEYHLSCTELNDMIQGFYMDVDPKLSASWSWYTEELDQSKWPDYSYFTMESTDVTDKMVVVLNHDLFDENSEYDKSGLERAQDLGFTTDNRITTEWVMSHPKEAVYILRGMSCNGDIYKKNKSSIEYWYQDIVNGNEE